jgi:glycosyltransferase 2 family protein
VRIVASVRPPSIEWAVISVAVTLVMVFAVSAFVIGFDALIGSLRKFDPATLGIFFLLMVWQVGCRFLRWFLYARCLGLKIAPHEAFLYYAAALGMTLTPGRLGEALRLWFLEKRFAVPYRRIVGLYVADRVSDATAYLILLAVGLAANQHGSPIAWGSLLLTATVIVLIMNPRPIIALLNAIYAFMRRGRKLVVWLRRAIRNTSTLFQPRVFLPGVAIGTVGWFAAPAVLTVSLSKMGVGFDLFHAMVIYAAAALAGGSTMMPGGGGATETVLVVLLTRSDVPLDAAISAMIVTRMMFLWLPVGLGTLLLPVAMKTVRRGGKEW